MSWEEVLDRLQILRALEQIPFTPPANTPQEFYWVERFGEQAESVTTGYLLEALERA